MLYRIHSSPPIFSVGTIRIRSRDEQGIYSVYDIEDLINIIIPHFEKYILLTKKRADYLLFKQVIAIMKNKEHLTIEGLIKIVSIRASMNKGLSEILYTNFPDVVPVEIPRVELPKTIDPN